MEWQGLCASTVATCVCFPVDTWKMQLQAKHSLRLAGSYRGLLSELAGSCPSSILYWGSYRLARERDISIFWSSMIGACVGNLVDTPFDIRKKQRQLHIPTGFSKSIVARFGVVNVLHSCAYNCIYMPLLKTLTVDCGMDRTISIFMCCTVANILSYPIDRWRTSIITDKPLAVWWKGLGTRLVYGNIYSGLYMHIFLWMSDGKL